MPAINHLAVLVAVVISQVLGYLWYSVLFSKPWAIGYRLEPDALAQTPPWAYAVTLSGALLFSYGTAVAVGLLALSGATAGILLGAGIWLGVLVPRYTLHAAFGRIAPGAIAIDLGFDLVVSVSTATILTLWLPG